MGTPISGYGPPTTKTRAQVGDFYIDQDSQKAYKCTAVKPGSTLDYGFIDIHQGHDNEYEWFDPSRIPISNATDLFYAGRRLDIADLVDTSRSTYFINTFYDCKNALTHVPNLDTSSGTEFTAMFFNCTALKSIPHLDTSNGKWFNSMFQSCTSLTSIPEIDTSKGMQFEKMFMGCTSLKSVQNLNTVRGNYFSSMFNGCSSITSITGINLRNAYNNTAVSSMFANCTKLTDLKIYDVKYSMQIGSGTTWGHLLSVDSLVHTIKELLKSSAQATLTIGSANLAKIADLYCKVIDDTTEKIEMELCESTDEGAMTLSDYALLKKWVFK